MRGEAFLKLSAVHPVDTDDPRGGQALVPTPLHDDDHGNGEYCEKDDDANSPCVTQEVPREEPAEDDQTANPLVALVPTT